MDAANQCSSFRLCIQLATGCWLYRLINECMEFHHGDGPFPSTDWSKDTTSWFSDGYDFALLGHESYRCMDELDFQDVLHTSKHQPRWIVEQYMICAWVLDDWAQQPKSSFIQFSLIAFSSTALWVIWLFLNPFDNQALDQSHKHSPPWFQLNLQF